MHTYLTTAKTVVTTRTSLFRTHKPARIFRYLYTHVARGTLTKNVWKRLNRELNDNRRVVKTTRRESGKTLASHTCRVLFNASLPVKECTLAVRQSRGTNKQLVTFFEVYHRLSTRYILKSTTSRSRSEQVIEGVEILCVDRRAHSAHRAGTDKCLPLEARRPTGRFGSCLAFTSSLPHP